MTCAEFPETVFERRFGTTIGEFESIAIANAASDDATRAALETCDVVIVAHESGRKAMKGAEMVRAWAKGAKRVVCLSRVGVNRRTRRPFDGQNKPAKAAVSVGGMSLPIGEPLDGGVGALDAFAKAEETLRAGRATLGYELSIVRSGQLRGNGPLLLADYSARLVDNLMDVKYQDIFINLGDTSEGYTKRLNLAQFIAHVSTTRADDAPEDVAVLSVVTETGMFGEKTLTEPTDRERRKGYDMAKGKIPPPVSTDVIDRLLDEAIAAGP
ncbi:hypothetical protein BE221DRAFT_190663 [Ostreococcus tauri]|uniref:Uncharacterized protein n=1 Tax=Ostreococcus tauri TaxID=70448 RepID=A0A1Y5IGE0_OSTTA|nr:hypothetical protein BE221DRAFT_190663 [Ostreococcus tauri]